MSLLMTLVFPLALHAQAPAGSPTALEWAQRMEQGLVTAIEQAERSVVAIARVRRRTDTGRQVPGPLDALRNVAPLGQSADLTFGRPSPTSPEFVPNQYCTGVVISRQGLIVTTYHTLGDPEKNDYYVWVRRKPYKVVGVERAEKIMAGDPWTDLAVLKIKANDLTPMAMGDAKQLKKGMIVVGLGNPYAIARDGEVSASWGIVANLRRQAAPRPKLLANQPERETLHHFGTLIQTDVKLNLGTSGGALINLRGEMVGLLTSQAALYGYEKAAGYAIPVDAMFRRTLETLKAGKKVQVGFLGVAPEDLSWEWRQRGRLGTRVEHVVPGTPAKRAGLLVGDIITHVNRQRVENRMELFRELGQLPVQAEVVLRVERGASLQQAGRIISLHAVLSKKYVETSRPAYSQQADPRWRGLQVDYATALPPAMFRQHGHKMDPLGCVAIVSVEAGSASWNAGLRPGEFIKQVARKSISTPEQFLRVVSELDGPVRLRLTVGQGEQGMREVAAP
ncbi:MAG: trypsin-like peptidase domain-containing protein [Pirellulaceae bacterium]